MKYWNDLDGSIFFKKIFTTVIPIDEISLFSLTIDNDRPTIILEFDISEYPDAPPLKWKQHEFNTCRIGLNCSNIDDLLVKKIPTKEKLHLTISKHGKKSMIRAANRESVIEFTTEHPLLCGPSAYRN